MCGEKFMRSARVSLIVGSSPRVRGKAMAFDCGAVVRGIIPACAGKRRWVAEHAIHDRDHPRVCGEKTEGAWQGAFLSGSSPRVRGKGKFRGKMQRENGIIPACAGKSIAGALVTFADGDHPRVCGEKNFCNWKACLRLGSSPRVRGKGYPLH